MDQMNVIIFIIFSKIIFHQSNHFFAVNCHNSAVVPSICSNDAFDCNDNKTCLPLDKVCNGVSDCPNGTDESDDCEVSCTKLNCQSACRKSPDGQGTCTCPQGYQLGQDQLSCEDVDECQTFGQCSQRCINHPGNFECRCEEGYEMVDKVCRARGIKSPMLLFAGKSEVSSRLENLFVGSES